MTADDVTPLASWRERARAIFDSAPLGISVTETRTRRILEANPRYAEITGRTVDELIGMDWIELTHPDDVETDLATTEQMTSKVIDAFKIPKRYVKPDGSVFWIEMSIAPIPTEPGAEELHLCMIDDITERRQVELHREQLVDILEASPDYVATTDLDGRILWANAAARSLFGVATVDDLQTASIDLFHQLSPVSRKFFRDHAVPELWASGTWVGEVDALLADGALEPLSFATIAHFGDDGYPQYFSGTGRDISALKDAEAALAAAELRMRTLVESAPIGIFEANMLGECTYANPTLCAITGVTTAADLGLGRMIHPDDAAAASSTWASAIASAQPAAGQFRLLTASGAVRWADIDLIPITDDQGLIQLFLGTVDDVTERVELERSRFESAEMLRFAFDNAPTGMTLTDARSAGPVLVKCNTAFLDLVGRTADEVIGHDLREITDGLDHAELTRGRVALLDREIDSHQMELRTLRPDGSAVWCQLTRSVIRGQGGEPMFFISQLVDISAERAAREEMARYAFTDPLTGLANRRRFLDHLTTVHARRTESGEAVAVVFIDLDHFKTINDHLGHDAGDALLVDVEVALRASVRSGDLVARLGGDEFAIVIAEADEAVMRTVSERLQLLLQFPRTLPGGDTVVVTGSIGIAWAEPGETTDELLRRADLAMYRAKRQGRNRIVVDDAGVRPRRSLRPPASASASASASDAAGR